MAKYNKNGFTLQQQDFFDLYLADPERNGTRIYQVVYPKTNKKAANSAASRLLATVKGKKYLDTRLDKITSKLELKQERVLEEIANIAFMDPGELLNDAGDLKPLQDLPVHVRAAIQSFEIVTEQQGFGEDVEIQHIRKVRFHPKMQALDMAMKYFNLYKLQLEVSGKVEHVHRTADEIPFSDIRKKAINGKFKRVG